MFTLGWGGGGAGGHDGFRCRDGGWNDATWAIKNVDSFSVDRFRFKTIIQFFDEKVKFCFSNFLLLSCVELMRFGC